jgi:transposase-like protein
MDECRNIHADVVDRFRVNNKNQVKMIFVDETLIQIEGKDYWWLWIALHNMNLIWICVR